MAKKIKILIVGDPASIHTSRFVMLLQGAGYETRLFQSEISYSIDEQLKNCLIYVTAPTFSDIGTNSIVAAFPINLNYSSKSLFLSFIKGKEWFSRYIINLCQKRERYKDLINVIGDWNPELVISLKMQNDGYTVNKARDYSITKFRWLHYCWGTDIEFFGKDENYKFFHLPKIKKLLSECDYLITDCKRDYLQSLDYGFKGKYLGTFIANGGFDIKQLSIIRKNNLKEKLILIKGREGGLVGRAFVVLAALHKISKYIKDYKVKIIMPSTDIIYVAKFLSQIDGINYEIVPRLPYNNLLELFAKSLITISASNVDGTPLFLAESMILGCFPIHSDMSSVREWIKNGENGLLFNVNNVDELAKDILKVINDKKIIMKAKKTNWKISKKYFNREKIKNKMKYLIDQIVSSP